MFKNREENYKIQQVQEIYNMEETHLIDLWHFRLRYYAGYRFEGSKIYNKPKKI